MSDYVVSVIRTVSPAIAGAIVAALVKAGVEIDSTVIEGAIFAIATGVWYAVVRWLEAKVPWVGSLLGVRKTPTY